jgi:hypothetical protein
MAQIPTNFTDGISNETILFNPLSSGAQTQKINDEYANLKNLIQVSQIQIETSLINRTMSVAKLDDFTTSSSEDVLKNYPYVLSVIDVSNGGTKFISQFRLPINPQELTIQTPFAIKTTVTSGGILEEHNGAPLKFITINGTTGGIINRVVNNQSIVNGGVFSGTLDAINQAVSSATALVSQAKAQSPTTLPIENTGYYQMHILDMFLSTYAEIKKAAGNQGLRLVLSVPKDKVNYIITPQALIKRRSVQSPMEYMYSIQATAWATIDFNFPFADKSLQILATSKKDAFKDVLNKFRDLRNVISDFRNVVTAVGGDVQNDVIDPINTVIYAAKDAVGVAKSVADLTESLRKSAFPSIINNINSVGNDLGELADTLGLGNVLRGFVSQIKEQNSNYTQTQSSYNSSESDPKVSINTDSLLSNSRLTDAISINSLDLDQHQLDAISFITDQASSLTSNDYNKVASNLNALYRKLEPIIIDRDPMDEEWGLLYSLKSAVTSLYPLIATTSFDTSANDATLAQDPFLSKTALQFWQGVSEQNGIIFNKPEGKFSIPFPFKSSLEQLASIYLNDPKRWTEIAALNDLQYPYIDEDGFLYSFISNGADNQFNISSNKNLYVGQTIYLSSNSQLLSRRKITQIFQVSDDNFIVTVDGQANMDSFKIADNAIMKAYMPYTVNSLSNIFIPSSQVPADQNTLQSRPITYLNGDIDLIKFSKIDLLLDDNYDLAITQTGFANLAYGNANLIQAAKIKLKTPEKSLLLHPTFGAGLEIGNSVADLNLANTLKNISKSFASDPRFKSPSSAEIIVNGSAVFTNLVVPLNNGNGVLPITLPLSSK